MRVTPIPAVKLIKRSMLKVPTRPKKRAPAVIRSTPDAYIFLQPYLWERSPPGSDARPYAAKKDRLISPASPRVRLNSFMRMFVTAPMTFVSMANTKNVKKRVYFRFFWVFSSDGEVMLSYCVLGFINKMSEEYYLIFDI